MSSPTILVTNEGKYVRVLGINDNATVVTVKDGDKLRVFHFLPGQRYTKGEPIFTEGAVDYLGEIRLDVGITE